MSPGLAPVSVVIPLYNKEREIGRAIASVLNQSHPPDSIIVVDDGSTDDGATVVEQVDDARMRLIRQGNAGPSAARNRGIAESPTDLVALLDADDEWDPVFLDSVLRLHQCFPKAGLWGTSFRMVTDETGTVERPSFRGVPKEPGGLVRDFFRSSLKIPIVCCSSVLFSRTVLDRVGAFPEGERLGEDFDVWIRIALDYPIAYSPAPLSIYHKEADNRAMVREVYASRDTCLTRTLTRALEAGKFRYTTRRSVTLMLGTHLLEIARSAIKSGNGRFARELVREVVSMRVWPMRCLRRWRQSFRA